MYFHYNIYIHSYHIITYTCNKYYNISAYAHTVCHKKYMYSHTTRHYICMNIKYFYHNSYIVILIKNIDIHIHLMIILVKTWIPKYLMHMIIYTYLIELKK